MLIIFYILNIWSSLIYIYTESFLYILIINFKNQSLNWSFPPAVNHSSFILIYQILTIKFICWLFPTSINHLNFILVIFNKYWIFSKSIAPFQKALIIFNNHWSFPLLFLPVDYHSNQIRIFSVFHHKSITYNSIILHVTKFYQQKFSFTFENTYCLF